MIVCAHFMAAMMRHELLAESCFTPNVTHIMKDLPRRRGDKLCEVWLKSECFGFWRQMGTGSVHGATRQDTTS